MATLTFGSTNYKTSFNFETTTVLPIPGQPRHTFVQVPGMDGLIFIGTELSEQRVVVTGVIIGTTNDDLQTKFLALVNDLCAGGGFTTHPDANFISPARPVRDLTIQSFGPSTALKKFPGCSYDGFNLDSWGGGWKRPLTIAAQITIKFVQWKPQLTAA